MLIRRVPPRIDFGDLRRELGLPTGFPAAARDEAAEAAGHQPTGGRADRTDIPFVTVDPPDARDLDQAVCLIRRSGGFRVHYAIADVAAFVRPGGALDDETWRRGQTVYLPDGKVPLHPEALSEGAASLLPDADRAAVLWTIDVADDGTPGAARVERARVRSRAKLDYAGVQRQADAGALPEPITALPELGRLLLARAVDRGAISLPLPEQELEPDGKGWRLVLRGPLQVEDYNAQISLLTGMSAARIMLAGGLGLLRTMPPPRPEALDRLRTAGRALGVDWPDGASASGVLAALDPTKPRDAALLDHAAELLRGAGYTAFDGPAPERTGHGGVGAPYAHVTAPLRRLADRYATEVCLALTEGRDVPEWARVALPRLPKVMADTDRVASAAQRGAVDLAEAVALAGRVGERFGVTVIDVDEPRPGRDGGQARRPGGTVVLDEPAVRARCEGQLPLGERVEARLVTADPARRQVLFAHP